MVWRVGAVPSASSRTVGLTLGLLLVGFLKEQQLQGSGGLWRAQGQLSTLSPSSPSIQGREVERCWGHPAPKACPPRA